MASDTGQVDGDVGAIPDPEGAWIWTKAHRGWTQLPTDAVRGAGGLWAYFDESDSWEEFGSATFEAYVAAMPAQQTWNPGKGGYGGQQPYREKDGDIPEWDGHKSHRSVYFRKIEIWEETIGVPVQERGVRLLGKLSGEAFEKLENIKTKDLRRDDSVEYFKTCITNAYEPVEDYRVGKIMDHFLDEFSRKKGQEIVDYNRCWDNELQKAEKVAGELTPKWQTHLYIRKMKMSTDHVSRMLVGALGEYTVPAMKKAALTAFPNIAAMRGSGEGHRGGDKSGYHARRSFKPRGRGKGRGRGKRYHGTHEVEYDGEGSEEEEGAEATDSEEAADVMLEDQPDSEEGGSTEDDCPEELNEAMEEAMVLLTRAKKQRAEVEKARGFFKKGAKQDGKDDKVGAMKNKLPCSKCGGLGHWHKDKTCPKFDQPFKDKPGGRKPFKKHRKKKAKRSKYALRKSKRHVRKHHEAHIVYVTTLNGLELPHTAYADTACAKSVGGEPAAAKLMKYIDEHGGQYYIVDEKEPFRFGPGKRIWSKRALIITVMWGGQIIVLRFSLVDQDIPFLISKFVFKRLGAVLDLEENTLTLKKLSGAAEPLYDLVTGHVGVELVKVGSEPVVASPETVDLCKGGDEVNVENITHRKLLGNIIVDNSTHMVDLPNTFRSVKYVSETDDENDADIESLAESSEDEFAEEQSAFLMDMLKTTKTNARTRAAPFYSEVLPGWRARAKELAPPYKRRERYEEDDINRIPVEARMERRDLQRLDASGDDDELRGKRLRGRKVDRQARKEELVDMESDKRRVSRNRKAGAGDDSDSCSEGDSVDSSGVDTKKQRDAQGKRRPSQQSTQGTREHEQRVSSGGSEEERTADRRNPDEAVFDVANSGRLEDAQHFKLYEHSSGSEYEQCDYAQRNRFGVVSNPGSSTELPSGRGCSKRQSGRADGRKLCSEASGPFAQEGVEGPTPFAGKMESRLFPLKGSIAWAKAFLTNSASKVMRTNTSNPLIHDQCEFDAKTQHKENWTALVEATTKLPIGTEEGFDDPCWRQTVIVETGEVLESRPLPSNECLVQDNVVGEPVDMKTTVWFGKSRPQSADSSSRVTKRLTKGIRLAAAIFLLEATVMLAAGCEWSGAWTQSLYGTTTADVWEVFTDHGTVTDVSYRQGWRTLEPLTDTSFTNNSDYIDVTLKERVPRLMVMECPAKVWHQCAIRGNTHANADRQKDKKSRSAIAPFLKTTCDIAERQLNEGRDFLIEAPANKVVYEDTCWKKLFEDCRVNAANGDLCTQGLKNTSGKYVKRSTIWLSSSKDIADVLDDKCKCGHAHGLDKAVNLTKWPEPLAKSVMKAFNTTLQWKEPSRIHYMTRALDARIRGAGMFADDLMVELQSHMKCSRCYKTSDVYKIINEKKQPGESEIPDAGIEFDIPEQYEKNMTKSLLSSVRRLHLNSGHPPNDELERVVRLSGGSELARIAVKGIRCTTCRKAAPPKIARPGRVKQNIGQFNDTVMIDLAYEKDADGKTHTYLVIVDEGSDWCVIKYVGDGQIGEKTADALYRKLEEAWIDWAGPPDVTVGDSERGFISEEFCAKLARAGSMYIPSAGYAPWQKGKVERKIQSMCAIIRKTILHQGCKGCDEMRVVGVEAASALNHRPGASGVSPGMMLFGQKMKLYGELYANGEPAYHHLDGHDPSNELGRRLQIRCSARQAAEHYFAKEMVRKTVAARTRKTETTAPGELVFFYRNYPSTKSQKLQALRGCYLGPGVVIGHQGKNAWVAYAGRCYLVAPEHIRGLAPDEIALTKPLIRAGLDQLQKASKAAETVDISGQQAMPDDIAAAMELPPGEELAEIPPDDAINSQKAGGESEQLITPVVELLPPEPDAPIETEADALKGLVRSHIETEPDNEPAAKRPAVAASSADEAAPPPPPVTWTPSGDQSDLRWTKEPKSAYQPYATQARVLTAKIKKKMLDKEVPFHLIPQKDMPLYTAAEDKEWKSWNDSKSVKVISGKEAATVRKETDPRRIIRIRFVYRDKNASIRTPQVNLPVLAKARLCAQASSEPLAQGGHIKLDSPTVQRLGITVFLQLTINFGWMNTTRKGDISAAFLQGQERDTSVKGRLFLEPPKGRTLAGVKSGDLLEVIKSVYGLPDAPRAWWEEVTGYLKSVGFQHSRIDVAYMILYDDSGSVTAMLILHVDDIMVATDGSKHAETIVEKFHRKYPFGEWEYIKNHKEIAYTGRTIRLVGTEFHITHEDFIKGRMDDLDIKRGGDLKRDCTPEEHAEFRSGVGNLHWVTSQVRVDHAVDTSRLQKRQNKPTLEDLKDLDKVIKEVKATANQILRIRPIKNPIIAAFTDSSLYGAEGELIEDDSDLEGFDKHKIHSQGGSLVVMMNRDSLDDLGDVPFSIGDWRTKASRRVFHATFAAEAQAAAETVGLARYYRAYMCDILYGYADWRAIDEYGEDELPIVLYTDCKGLFDNLKKDGSVPEDKWVAISIAALRGAVSAGPERNKTKSECRWVPSRWQLADCLTKKGLGSSLRERLSTGSTRLHELSLAAIKRNTTGKPTKKKPSKAHLVYLVQDMVLRKPDEVKDDAVPEEASDDAVPEKASDDAVPECPAIPCSSTDVESVRIRKSNSVAKWRADHPQDKEEFVGMPKHKKIAFLAKKNKVMEPTAKTRAKPVVKDPESPYAEVQMSDEVANQVVKTPPESPGEVKSNSEEVDWNTTCVQCDDGVMEEDCRVCGTKTCQNCGVSTFPLCTCENVPGAGRSQMCPIFPCLLDYQQPVFQHDEHPQYSYVIGENPKYDEQWEQDIAGFSSLSEDPESPVDEDGERNQRGYLLHSAPVEWWPYLLAKDNDLRESFVKLNADFPSMAVGLFCLQEQDVQGRMKNLWWIGKCKDAGFMSYPLVFVWQGTVLPCALHAIQFDLPIARGNTRPPPEIDKVEEDEAYCGGLEIALRYVKPFLLGGSTSVITLNVLAPESVRKAPSARKNNKGDVNSCRIIIAKKARVTMQLHRPDNETQTLTHAQRYMSDFTLPAEMFEEHRRQEAERKAARPRTADMSIDKANFPDELRQPDDEEVKVVRKLKAMAAVGGSKFLDANGRPISKADGVFEDTEENMNLRGWPAENGSEKGSFSFAKWKNVFGFTNGAKKKDVLDLSLTELDEEIIEASNARKQRLLAPTLVDPKLVSDMTALKQGKRTADGVDIRRVTDQYWRKYPDTELAYAFRRGSASAHLALAKSLKGIATKRIAEIEVRGDDRKAVIIHKEEAESRALKVNVKYAMKRLDALAAETVENYVDPVIKRMDWICQTCKNDRSNHWWDDKQKKFVWDDGKRSYELQYCKTCSSPQPDPKVTQSKLIWMRNRAAIHNMREARRRVLLAIKLNNDWVEQMERRTDTHAEPVTSTPGAGKDDEDNGHWEMVEAPEGIVDDDSDLGEPEKVPTKAYMASIENMRETQFEMNILMSKSTKRTIKDEIKTEDGDNAAGSSTDAIHDRGKIAPWKKDNSGDVYGVDGRYYPKGTHRDRDGKRVPLETKDIKWQASQSECKQNCGGCMMQRSYGRKCDKTLCARNCYLPKGHKGNCVCGGVHPGAKEAFDDSYRLAKQFAGIDYASSNATLQAARIRRSFDVIGEFVEKQKRTRRGSEGNDEEESTRKSHRRRK